MIHGSPLPCQASPYTGPTHEDLTHIPAALKARRQWILWRGAVSRSGMSLCNDKCPWARAQGHLRPAVTSRRHHHSITNT
jgi:hypothetical protein